MSDLDNFKAMLKRSKTDFEEFRQRDEWILKGHDWASKSAATVIAVMPGYRAHYEAAFDANGDMLESGQFAEL